MDHVGSKLPAGEKELRVTIADISRGATTLLAIAQENDRHKKIAANTALEVSLDCVRELPALCANRDRSKICELLGRPDIPPSWFEFCVALVAAIESRVEKAKDSRNGGYSLRTDFDRSVYLALGQAIAEATKAVSKARLTLELSTAETFDSLGRWSGTELQKLLIKNYVGNILQELFDACKVRLRTAGLPADTERNLREKDADVVMDSVFESAPPPESREIVMRLQTVLSEIWQRDAMAE